MKHCAYLLLLLFLASCARGKLAVQSEYMTVDRYASVFVGTPDPKKVCPDLGQRLLIEWRLKKEFRCFDELTLVYKLHFRNYETVEENRVLRCPVGRIAYMLMNEEFCRTDGLMAYDVQIFGDGKLLARRCHYLMQPILHIDAMQMQEEEPLEIDFDPIDDVDFGL